MKAILGVAFPNLIIIWTTLISSSLCVMIPFPLVLCWAGVAAAAPYRFRSTILHQHIETVRWGTFCMPSFHATEYGSLHTQGAGQSMKHIFEKWDFILKMKLMW